MNQPRARTAEERLQADGGISQGAIVYGSEGQQFGHVAAVYRQYLIVERGFFFPKDYFVPLSAIESKEGDRVYLKMPSDLALHQGWDHPPAEATSARRASRAATAETDSESTPARPSSPSGGTGAPYPDTYAVGTNTDSYGVVGQTDPASPDDGPEASQ